MTNHADFETELRATLDAAGREAPEATALADRASRPVRRRRGGLAIGAAAVGVLAVATSVALLGPGRSTEVPVAGSGPDTTAQTTTAPGKLGSATTAAALLGKWRPLQVPGATAKDLRGRPGNSPTIAFEKNGEWRGSDGCNKTTGKYTARDGGAFTGQGGPSTLMACEGYSGVRHGDALKAATGFTIEGSTLVFTGQDGKVVAKYEKVPA